MWIGIYVKHTNGSGELKECRRMRMYWTRGFDEEDFRRVRRPLRESEIINEGRSCRKETRCLKTTRMAANSAVRIEQHLGKHQIKEK